MGLGGLIVLLVKSSSVANPDQTKEESAQFPDSGAESELANKANTNDQNLPGESGSLGDSTGENLDDINFPEANASNSTNTAISKRLATPELVSKEPVVGATTFGTVAGGNLVLRYMEQNTGHIYDYKPLGKSTTRVSNTTLLKVKDILWANQGQSAIATLENDNFELENSALRLTSTSSTLGSVKATYIGPTLVSIARGPIEDERLVCKDIITTNLSRNANNLPSEVRALQSFLSRIDGQSEVIESGIYEATTSRAVSIFQERYASEVLTPVGLSAGTGSVGPSTRRQINKINCEKLGAEVNGARYAYITNVNGSAFGGINTFDSSKTSSANLFVSPLTEWVLAWPNKNTLTLTTKPSYQYSGSAYSISTSNTVTPKLENVATPIVTSKLGLTTNPRSDLELVLYGQSKSGTYSTTLLNTKTESERPFPVSTLPSEKCVWSRVNPDLIYCAAPRERLSRTLPDIWYQGLVSYNDNFYAIDTETDFVTLLYRHTGVGPDVESIFLSADGVFVYYIDKKTGLLWSLQVKDI